ncbi:MAG: hypothetical protein J6M26_06660 [Clostridia bacterium]|nr:hypothetical protein [Clostridia bacterium]
MKKRRFVLFGITNWIYAFAFLAAAAWLFYYGATELQGDKQIINYVGGVLGIAFVIGYLHIMGGFLIITEDRILVRFKLFERTTAIPINEIKMLYISGRTQKVSKIGEYVTLIQANAKDGPILGFGFMPLRTLIKHLNVPVYLTEYRLSVKMNVKLLLQRRLLSDHQAKMLMIASNVPKKYLDKWYNEPKQ